MTLDNPWPLAVKTALAASMAYVLCLALALPDGVSAAFVAVVCVTPTVIAGLRRAVGQSVGSLVGGGFAWVLMTGGLPIALSLGLSVGLSVWVVFRAGHPSAHVVAAFTAIYVHLLPLGAPDRTLWVRIAAVAVGALSAMCVNTFASAMFYQSIFERRLKRVEVMVANRLEHLIAGELEAMVPIFAALGALSVELHEANRELRWRRASAAAAATNQRLYRVRALQRLTHFAHDLGLSIDESGTALTEVDIGILKFAVSTLRGEPAPDPPHAGPIGKRVLATVRRYARLRGHA